MVMLAFGISPRGNVLFPLQVTLIQWPVSSGVVMVWFIQGKIVDSSVLSFLRKKLAFSSYVLYLLTCYCEKYECSSMPWYLLNKSNDAVRVDTVLHTSVVVQSMRKITIGLGGMQKLCFCLSSLGTNFIFIIDSLQILVMGYYLFLLWTKKGHSQSWNQNSLVVSNNFLD